MNDESRPSMVLHYIGLVLLLVVGIFGVTFFSGNRDVQLVIVWLMGGGYLLWGVLHHLVHNDFHFKVFVEYLLVAAIGVLPVSALLLQR